ncbi:MAG TPA: hypothetical protein VIP77_01380 [Jiangellaceae bacterium]
MSTLAVWLYVVLGLLLVLMFAFVVLSGMLTVRKGKSLADELGGLQRDLDKAVGSPDERRDGDE